MTIKRRRSGHHEVNRYLSRVLGFMAVGFFVSAVSECLPVRVSQVLVPSALAYQNRLDFTAGYFSLSGRNSRTGARAAVSGFASYRLGYRRAVTGRFDIGVGYTLAFSRVVTGDNLFGLDVQAHYYPMTAANSVESKDDETMLTITEVFRPYLGLSFIQRNFQGIQTTYVGFGGMVGAEYSLSPSLSLVGEAKLSSLKASSENSATEVVVSAGVSMGF